MPSLRILLVEDDRSVASTLAHTLKSSYEIDVASSGQLALYKIGSNPYDIVLLDINLPDTSGLTICKELRQRGVTAPILILSGESRVLTKISLLDAGANDYLTKPFALGELKARLRALTRNQPPLAEPAVPLKACGVVLDRSTFKVSRDGVEINLRPKEFELLECLMEKPGAVITRDQLIKRVWQDYEELWTNTLDVHIKHLRDKLDKPFDAPLIQTVYGRGYKLEAVAQQVTHEQTLG